MGENSYQSFTEFEVWKKTRAFKNEIRKLTLSFPAKKSLS